VHVDSQQYSHGNQSAGNAIMNLSFFSHGFFRKYVGEMLVSHLKTMCYAVFAQGCPLVPMPPFFRWFSGMIPFKNAEEWKRRWYSLP
ncbi:MAG: hypothetical protein KC563_05765, partial [Nitrospira sp.]|nr:hypothetical protein [Nitrospira sp.]